MLATFFLVDLLRYIRRNSTDYSDARIIVGTRPKNIKKG